MKTEFLILIPDDEAFCSTKKAFVDFIKVDALISVAGQKLTFRRTPKSKDLVSARFRVETDKVKSKQERYFLLVIECEDISKVDEFTELCDRIKSIAQRISPGEVAVNTLWDGVGRIYAEKAYPIINEVENLMRRLITKFMLITVGMNWSKDAINPELFKKIESFEEEQLYLNDLHKLDFIHLSQVLFEKKRDIAVDELDRLLSKTNFADEDKEKILRYLPKSNWEKYFSALIDEKDRSLEKKWELLYKLRNKVAHNRNVKKAEFLQVKGLSDDIKEIIGKATAKLGEIDLNEVDRELFISSYQPESPAAIVFFAEKAVADYYSRAGYEVEAMVSRHSSFDFIASNETSTIAIDTKIVGARSFFGMMRMIIDRSAKRWALLPEYSNFTKIHIVIVIREDDSGFPLARVFHHADSLADVLGEKYEVHLGRLNEEHVFVPLFRELELRPA